MGWRTSPEIEENGVVGYRGSDVLSLIVPEGFNLDYISRIGDQVNVNEVMFQGRSTRGIGAEDSDFWMPSFTIMAQRLALSS